MIAEQLCRVAERVPGFQKLSPSRRPRVLRKAASYLRRREADGLLTDDAARDFWGVAVLNRAIGDVDAAAAERRARRRGYRYFDPEDGRSKDRVKRMLANHPEVRTWVETHPYADATDWHQWMEDRRQVERPLAIRLGLTPPERSVLFLVNDAEERAYNRGEWGREPISLDPQRQDAGTKSRATSVAGAVARGVRVRLLSVQRRDAPAASDDASLALRACPASSEGPGVPNADAGAFVLLGKPGADGQAAEAAQHETPPTETRGVIGARPTALTDLPAEGRRRMVAFAKWLRRAAEREPREALPSKTTTPAASRAAGARATSHGADRRRAGKPLGRAGRSRDGTT